MYNFALADEEEENGRMEAAPIHAMNNELSIKELIELEVDLHR